MILPLLLPFIKAKQVLSGRTFNVVSYDPDITIFFSIFICTHLNEKKSCLKNNFRSFLQCKEVYII